MSDIYLQQQMLGALHPQETKYDRAYEKFLDDYVNALPLEVNPADMSSISEKKNAIKQDLKRQLDTFELKKQIATAIPLLIKEGPQYLDSSHFQSLAACFKNMKQKLEKLRFEEPMADNMISFFEIEDSVLADILKVGLSKFRENDFSSALSCFVLLAALDPGSIDYWYKEGIAAQKCEKYTLALNAYSQALQLDPTLLGARLFSIECYLEKKLIKEAEEEWMEIKKLETSDEWKEVIEKIEEKLQKFKF